MSRRIRVLIARRLRFLPHRVFAVLAHLLFQGELTTLRRPRTFAQMLAAKNLRPQPPLVHATTDKVAVRSHVADRIGSEHLIPLLQVVDDAADLDFDALAAAGPYVVKAAHGCEMTLLVPDPAVVDRDAVRATVARWLATDWYRAGWRETPYRGLPRRAVVETMIGDGSTPPADHKFYVVHGEPVMLAVDTDRFTGHRSTLLHPDWVPMAVTGWFDAADALPPRPASYPRMLEIARALGRDFAFARIDLYDDGGHVWFGEITHNPGGGLMRLRPREFDRALGDLWRNGTPLPDRFVRR